ncbi:hypothetical protein ACP4OV_003526 [Aristida adscensionis]
MAPGAKRLRMATTAAACMLVLLLAMAMEAKASRSRRLLQAVATLPGNFADWANGGVAEVAGALQGGAVGAGIPQVIPTCIFCP